MIDALVAFPILVLFVARVTILVIDDRITMVPRRWAQRRLATGGYLHYLTGCPMCVAVHVAWMTTLAWLRWPVGTSYVALVGALSLVAARLVAAIVDPSEAEPPPSPHD